jgi:phage host-nuclease inhibitor protein Gam
MANGKQKSVVAPQTADEANESLSSYGALMNDLARIEADMKDELAKTKARFEDRAEPLQLEASVLLAGLAAWAAANRKALTDGGKTKMVKLAAGVIGWRNAPSSIGFKRGVKAEEVVETLKGMRLFRFLRRTLSVNKEAMLDDKATAATVPGVIVRAGAEAFYVEPAGEELSEQK